MKKLLILLVVFLTACGEAPVVSVDDEDKVNANPVPAVTAAPAPTPIQTIAPSPEQKAPVKTTAPTPVPTPAPKPTETPIADTVTLSIYGETEMLNMAVEIQEGETAAVMVKRIAEENGIKVKIRGGGKLSYIVSIGGLAEFDCGPESGWTYYVNSEYMTIGAGNVIPKPGDTIEWKYRF